VEHSVRAARITDIDRFVALSGDRLGGRVAGQPAAADILRQLVFLPHATVLVAERKRDVIGGAVLAIRPSVAAGGFVGTIDLLVVDPSADPDDVTESLVEEALRSTPVVIVDFHAEATSEKVAFARYLDGRVTAVIGTHTHVQTSDARVLKGGTAAITDAGMTGPHDSVIGSDEHNALKRFLTGLPTRLEPATGDVRIEGALIECTADGRATSCTAVRVDIP